VHAGKLEVKNMKKIIFFARNESDPEVIPDPVVIPDPEVNPDPELYPDSDHLVRGTDPRIRIPTKMSRIPNTGQQEEDHRTASNFRHE
jgi:hypothetical protein